MIVKYLASLSADCTTNNNYTIQYTSVNKHLETVKYLVSLSADYTTSDAIQWVNYYGHIEIVQYLELLYI